MESNVEQLEQPTAEDLQKALLEVTSKYNELIIKNTELTNRYNELVRFVENNNTQMVFKHLEFAFEVIKSKDSFPTDFVNKCINTIIEIMSNSQEEKTNEQEA